MKNVLKKFQIDFDFFFEAWVCEYVVDSKHLTCCRWLTEQHQCRETVLF